MVKITSTNKSTNETFYFSNIDDCRKFMHVFRNHWCNVNWTEPEKVPDNEIDYDKKKYIHIDPEERARRNLSWGFNSTWKDEKDEFGNNLTESQSMFLASFMERIGK